MATLLLLCVAAAARGEVSSPARDLYEQGRYADAVRAGEQTLAEQRRTRRQAEIAQALQDLAAAYHGDGREALARAAAEEAVAMREQLGGRDLHTAAALVELAEVQLAAGEAAAALATAKRAMAIVDAARAAPPAQSARTLRVLAEAELAGGDPARALTVAERALARVPAGDDRDRAAALDTLGLVRLDLRDPAAAVAPLEEALRLRTAALGNEHPLTAESLNNLAAAYWTGKDVARALPLFEQALAIKQRSLGPAHPATATALNNLAEAERSLGNAERAGALLEQAVAALEERGGGDPRTATALANLGGVYWQARDYRRARPLLDRAVEIWVALLGPDHPATARALNASAALAWSAGAPDEALARYRRGLAAEERTLALALGISNEAQKRRYVAETQGHYLAALSLIARHFAGDPEAARFALDLVLRRKGIVLDAQARTNEALARSLGGEGAAAWQELGRQRGELARRLERSAAAPDAAAERREIERLQASVARLETDLARRSVALAQELAQRDASSAAVARRLPPDGVLIEIVKVPDWNEELLAWAPTARYLAFVLAPDGAVRLLSLGDAADIDRQVHATLTMISDRSMPDYVVRTDAALGALGQRLLAPLALPEKARRLIVSPDGEITKVPLAALRTPAGRYLIEDRVVSEVASGRDLLRTAGGTPELDLVIVANPAFDLRPPAPGGRAPAAVRASGFRGFRFEPLRGTAEEASVIEPLVGGRASVLTESRASESALRDAPPARVLHLATHGFFLADRAAGAPAPVLPVRAASQAPASPDLDAMVRSGLALAGANYADAIAAGDDGILTALEVTSLDLHGSDLVVLSACETGLGDVQAGEGVYGLRRAFVLAGAGTLVMSLWQVNDRITRELMERFYRARAAGQPPPEALRSAELETIADLRQRLGVAPVNLWAPFIVQQTGR